MGSPSKQESILELFFNEPSKQWHFEDILRSTKISRCKASKWLSKLTEEKIVIKVKKAGEMPYYIGNHEATPYRNRKKLYAQTKLYTSGFLDHLTNLQKAKTVIIFGSYTRSDWHEESDIDVFVYGEIDGLKPAEYSHKLKREIQVFSARNIYDLKHIGKDLIGNIITGNIVKGDLGFIKVQINEKT